MEAADGWLADVTSLGLPGIACGGIGLGMCQRDRNEDDVCM